MRFFDKFANIYGIHFSNNETSFDKIDKNLIRYFKVEFGRSLKDNNIILADEISPDTCRLWDSRTEKKLDKDIFRKDLGNLIEGYQEVARRLDILHEQSNVRPIKFPKPQAVKIKKK